MKAITHTDHITYVAAAEREQAFVSEWSCLGLKHHTTVQTKRFPASHIALTSGVLPGRSWGIMTGLSISSDPASPVNELVRRYGEGIQHVAYAIDPEADMDAVHDEMKRAGMELMTGVLTYKESSDARLRQMFIAPSRPYGTFVEYIQRLPGCDGQPFNGFDPVNIDDLYQAYSDYSRWLEKSPKIQVG